MVELYAGDFKEKNCVPTMKLICLGKEDNRSLGFTKLSSYCQLCTVSSTRVSNNIVVVVV